MRVLFKVQPVSCSLTVAPSLSASAGEHRGSPLLQPQYLPPAVTPALGGGGGGKGGVLTRAHGAGRACIRGPVHLCI